MTTTQVRPEIERAGLAAAAAVSVLPATTPLSAGAPQAGALFSTDDFRGMVVAPVTGSLSGRVAVLVGEELVAALATDPSGVLSLAAVLQPTVDAITDALGANPGPAQEGAPVDLAAMLSDQYTAVPLISLNGFAAAIVLTDGLLVAPPAPEEVVVAVPMVGTPSAPVVRGLEMLHGVDMELTVELGRTRMAVRDLLALTPGDVLELDRAAGSPADLLVNGRLIARGEVVVVDENFGLRITQIIDSSAV